VFIPNFNRPERYLHRFTDDQQGLDVIYEESPAQDEEGVLHEDVSRGGVLQDGIRQDTGGTEERSVSHTRSIEAGTEMVQGEEVQRVESLQGSE